MRNLSLTWKLVLAGAGAIITVVVMTVIWVHVGLPGLSSTMPDPDPSPVQEWSPPPAADVAGNVPDHTDPADADADDEHHDHDHDGDGEHDHDHGSFDPDSMAERTGRQWLLAALDWRAGDGAEAFDAAVGRANYAHQVPVGAATIIPDAILRPFAAEVADRGAIGDVVVTDMTNFHFMPQGEGWADLQARATFHAGEWASEVLYVMVTVRWQDDRLVSVTILDGGVEVGASS